VVARQGQAGTRASLVPLAFANHAMPPLSNFDLDEIKKMDQIDIIKLLTIDRASGIVSLNIGKQI
jgi:hypothetical protein